MSSKIIPLALFAIVLSSLVLAAVVSFTVNSNLELKDILSRPYLLYLYAGNSFFKEGLFSDAIKSYKMAISFNQDFAEAYYNIGVANAKQDNYEEAIKWFDKSLELKKEYKNAYYSRGVSYYRLNELEKAKQDLIKVIEIEYDINAYFDLGVILVKQFRLDEAEGIIDLDKLYRAKEYFTAAKDMPHALNNIEIIQINIDKYS